MGYYQTNVQGLYDHILFVLTRRRHSKAHARYINKKLSEYVRNYNFYAAKKRREGYPWTPIQLSKVRMKYWKNDRFKVLDGHWQKR